MAINVCVKSPSQTRNQTVEVEGKKPKQLAVTQTIANLLLYEPTWSVLPRPLYCVSWYCQFIAVSAATAIPNRHWKEMQYA